MHLDDAIGSYGSQNILNDCFNSSAADPSPLCALFNRRADGSIERLFDRRANKGGIDTAGVDFGLAFRRESGLGEFRAGLVAALIGPVAATVGGGLLALIITITWARLFPELRDADRLDVPDSLKG